MKGVAVVLLPPAAAFDTAMQGSAPGGPHAEPESHCGDCIRRIASAAAATSRPGRFKMEMNKSKTHSQSNKYINN